MKVLLKCRELLYPDRYWEDNGNKVVGKIMKEFESNHRLGEINYFIYYTGFVICILFIVCDLEFVYCIFSLCVLCGYIFQSPGNKKRR